MISARRQAQRGVWLFFTFAFGSLWGCRHTESPPSPPTLSPAPAAFVQPQFKEVTKAAGIAWTHNPCRTGKKYLPETVGGGGGFLDYNNDGFLDILLINGAPLPGYKGSVPHLALYRNNGNGTFTEVTRESGLNFSGYGIGLAVADYDNDGWSDLLITALGRCRLFHNEKGHFTDVTERAGIRAEGFCTAAAWVDFDHDGQLDLFIARYVAWTPETDLPCGPEKARQYCPPHQYRGAPPMLFRNRGDRTFEDVSARSGVLGHSSKSLAVVPCDVNHDGWTDLYIANDTEPDLLLVNNRQGGFEERGLPAGIALGSDGSPTGSMGADMVAPFHDERLALAVGTFAGQELSLFVAPASPDTDVPLFENRKQEAGIAPSTRPMTTFGLAFADVDLDGWPDLLVVNGHIDDDQSISVGGQQIAYRQPTQLFQNRRDGTFQEIGRMAGLAAAVVGRGLAIGDYDNDGKPDCLIFENGGPVRLWHNETQTTGHWLGVKLVGKKNPADGTGAVVTVKSSEGVQSRFASTTRSYLAANDPRLHFGLGNAQLESVSVKWPDGTVSTASSPRPDQYLTITE